METTAPKFGIGILGCARVAKKNCRAAKSASCQITAVASRSKEKAEGFVSAMLSNQESVTIFAGEDAYAKLLNSNSEPSCCSVYIPLPTMLHEQYVARALSSSKHVLLEKPVAISSASYREMLDAASRNGKFLMDGTMFVHHPRTKAFVKSIPNPNRVTFNFTFDASGDGDFFRNNIRIKKDGDFMGCIGDMGWYCIRMGLLVFDAGTSGGMATEVQVVRYQLNEEGIPFDADCLVHFSENRVLSFHCSFIHPLNQTVTIYGSGSEHTATMTDAILPRKGSKLSFSLVKQDLTQYDEITIDEEKEMHYDNSRVQEVCMWSNFAKWARKIEEEHASASAGIDEKHEMWWAGASEEVKEANIIASYSLHTQIVLDALMESIELGGAKVQVKAT